MNEEEQTTKLTFTGEVSFEQLVTKSQAGQIIAFLGTSASAPITSQSAPTAILANPSQTSSRFETPRTAIDETGAKTNPEKIVALAGYVLQEGTRETFTIDDIKPLFKRAGEVTPKNIGRDLLVAIKSGYIDESEQRGDYYFTRKAQNAIENGFVSNESTVSRKKSGRRASKSKPQTVSQEMQAIEVATTLSGYPGFYKLKTKSDKFLWVLALAKKSDVVSLAPSELAFLSDNIGEGIPSNDVNAYFRVNQKKGFVNKSLQDKKIRLTPTGEEYLKSLNNGD